MTIIKRSSVGSIDAAEDKKPITYCLHCEEFGLRRPLGERIYKPDEFGNLSIPADHDKWRQCYYCGNTYPKYAVKEESMIEPFVTVSDNPFDQLSSTITAADSGRGGKRGVGVLGHRKKRDPYKDEDINKEIRHGGKVISYSES